MPSSGMLRHVTLVRTDVSEEQHSSILHRLKVFENRLLKRMFELKGMK
jgi:hypothetical protein